uniref:hypothetical protein n=1 Tax=Pseudomonas aeruginosa TaxID=287 RepID=UPI0021B0441B|nr:hypothetical protein [Pseudomonas aeruginosa]
MVSRWIHEQTHLWQTTAGQTTDDDREEFLMQYGALSALLSLAHEKASGLTPEAVQQLREIEVAEVKANRATRG